MSALEAIFLFATSGPVFYYYYARDKVTFDKWKYKSNPKFPTPEKVIFLNLYSLSHPYKIAGDNVWSGRVLCLTSFILGLIAPATSTTQDFA